MADKENQNDNKTLQRKRVILVMKQGKSIKINFIMNCILTLSSIVFPLISFPYVSRILSPSGIGKVSFATSVVAYFLMFAQMGIPTYGIRACAKVRDDKRELNRTVRELLTINLILCICVYILFIISLLVVPRFREERLLLIILGLNIGFNALGVEWLYRALEEYTYIAIRSIVFKFLALVLMLLLVRTSEDYLIYGGLTIFAAVGSNIFNFINMRRYVDLKDCEKLDIRRHLKPISVFFGMSIAATVYSNMDTVMLGFMKTDVDVGLYNAAVKIKYVLVSVVTSLGAVLLPRSSYYIEKGQVDQFYTITRKGLNFVFIAAGSLTVFFMMFAEEGIMLLSGVEFRGAIEPMILIMPTLLFVGVSNIIGLQMLVPLGREKCVLISEIIGAIVNIIINGILIPYMSSSGASIGTVAAELAVVLVQIVYLKELVYKDFKEIETIKIVLSIAIASIVTYWCKYFKLGSFLTLIVAGALFYSIIGCFLVFSREKFTHETIMPTFKRVMQKVKRNNGD